MLHDWTPTVSRCDLHSVIMVARVRVERLAIDDPKWTSTLERVRHDFYHLPAYVELEAARLDGMGLAFLAQSGDEFVFAPAVERPIHDTLQAKDLTAPYGFASPLFSDAESPANIALLQAMLGRIQGDGYASAFFRLHPILEAPHDTLEQFGTLVCHGQTIWIDLQKSKADQWADYRGVNRNLVRRLIRDGFSARWDPTWDNYEDFIRLYTTTMRRVDAADWYYFDRAYFSRLRDTLSKQLRLGVVEHAGRVVAAGLFSRACGIVQYYLSGSDPSFRKHSPTRLLLDYVRDWATDAGDRVFHLGGGLGGQADSLFKFKAGFSKGRRSFHTWRVIADQATYLRLVDEWHARTNGVADAANNFFPAYRKPGEPPSA